MHINTLQAGEPLVSVIIPCYNAAHFVAETIRSVAAQSYSNWELILIDDGSSDNTVEVIQPFLEDRRIRFHTQKNQGVSAARNNGAAFARGDFIAFLDSDDVWLPEKLHRQLDVFRKYPAAGICGSGYIEIDAGSKPTRGQNTGSPTRFTPSLP
jgi:glycosyltransferase involved in cell wall biosynthesis